MSSTVYAKLQLRRGTAAEWASANPVLAAGEPAFETDTGIRKVGDGVSSYANLPKYATYDEVVAAQSAAEAAEVGAVAARGDALTAKGQAETAQSKAETARDEAQAAASVLEGLSGSASITRSGATNTWNTTATPFVSVALSPARAGADYAVIITPTDADDMAAIGNVLVYDKAINAFKVRISGSTDNFDFNWRLVESA